MVNLSYPSYPWFFFGEAFSMDHDYSTSPYILDSSGDVKYDLDTQFLYEFVEDNDDQDRLPDWSRANQSGSDFTVFPGWDENNDFISDFNQNDNETISNRVPDYEEPFLRYSVDRPEYLFGIDLNNNGWIDRFENDEEADYPYKKDRQGYNAYIGTHITPYVRVSGGQTREEQLSSQRENTATYGLVTFDKDYPQLGRLRIFNMLKKVEDEIPDDYLEAQPFLVSGPPGKVVDLLPAQDTWVNSLWLGFDYTRITNLNIHNKVKYEFYSQQADDPRALDRSPLDDHSYFFGLINKVDYSYRLRDLIVQPRFKSEFLREDPFLQREKNRKEWTKLLSLVMKFPMLRKSSAELGIEFVQFSELKADEDQLEQNGILGPTGDFNESILALQWSTVTDYMGYRLILQTGFRVSRKSVEQIEMMDNVIDKKSETETNSATFLTIYAGVEQ